MDNLIKNGPNLKMASRRERRRTRASDHLPTSEAWQGKEATSARLSY
jgi:hypothetical protein